VAGLALGDYLLWNSSVGGGSSILAFVSGLSLVPLALATAWLLVLTLARALARSTRPRTQRPRHAATHVRGPAAPRVMRLRADGLPTGSLRAGALLTDADAEKAQATAATASSRKIAA
jgi:hypothetical protein